MAPTRGWLPGDGDGSYPVMEVTRGWILPGDEIYPGMDLTR
jgi:hypothetical protein